jgi:hypothetical protein
MKQPWWERRREYLAEKGKSPARVINITDGHIKLLAERIREQKGGRARSLEGSGASSACVAPVKTDLPAEGGAA